MDKVSEILDYWFEGVDDATRIDTKKPPFAKWFAKDKRVDAEIRELFGNDLNAAAEGRYKSWEKTAKGRLALIILYDQFSRNMYRDTPRMYAYDALALELTLRMISEGMDRDLSLIERAFAYLPLMHFEDLALQEMSLDRYTQLKEECKEKQPDNAHYYEYTLKYAVDHHDTIAKFGRFPYRDAILSRNAK